MIIGMTNSAIMMLNEFFFIFSLLYALLSSEPGSRFRVEKCEYYYLLEGSELGRGPGVRGYGKKTNIIEDLLRSEQVQKSRRRYNKKIDLGRSERGMLKLAGRTLVILFKRFFGV